MNSDFQTLPTVVKLNPKDKIQIIRAEITRDLKLAIDILNVDDKSITDITFSVVFKDENDSYLFNGSEFFYYSKNLNIQPHTVYYIEPFVIDERFNTARKIEIYIKNITFVDGRAREYNNSSEKEFTLPIIPDKKQEKIESILGPEILTYGENLIDGWRCVCGAINEKESQECINCKRNKNFVLNNLTEPLINLKLLNTLSGSLEYDEEKKDILTSNLTQTQLTKIAPEAEELEEKRVNPIDIVPVKQKSSLKIFLKVLVTVLVIFALLFAGIFAFKFFIKLKTTHQLEDARAYVASGKYEDALVLYNDVKENNNKKDINSEIEDTKKLLESQRSYERGNDLILKSEYLASVKSFKEVIPEDTINFSNSQDKISELENIILQKAKTKLKASDKNTALKIVNDYLKVVPESANAINLRDMILKNSLEEKSIEEKLNDSIEEGFETDKSRAKITKKAENLLNTYQKVRASKGNLRVSPSIDSDIIVVLPTDSDLYVQETKIEGEERIWCKVEAKNINTGEVFHGWISNKIMEEGTDL